MNEDGPGWSAARLHTTPVATIVLVVSLLITLLGWLVASRYAEQRAQQAFTGAVDKAVGAISARLVEYEQMLRGTAGLFAASDEVTRADWQAYVDTLRIETYWPGIQGIGYAQMLRPDELAAYQDGVRAEGFPDFQVNPTGRREIYSSIHYLQPMDWRNRRAFGFDMYSEPVRRAAMQRARDTGLPARSGRVTLVQETDQDVQAGFLVYLPIYRKQAVTDGVEQRRAALLGFVYSPFRTADLMRGILGSGMQALHFTIHDGNQRSADSLLYDSHPEESAAQDSGARNTVRHIDLQGRTWTLSFHSRPAFQAAASSWLPALVAGGGVLVDVLLFTILLSLASRQRLAVRSAMRLREVVTELADATTALRHAHRVAGIGPWTMDIRADRMTWSEQAALVYGSRPADAISRSAYLQMVHPDDVENLRQTWRAALASGDPFQHEHRILVAGEERWVAERAEFEVDGHGQVVAATGTVQDITERRRAEAQLQLAASVFAHAGEAIVVTDGDGRIVDVNNRFSALTGYSHDEAVGQPISILRSERHDAALFADMWRSLGQSGEWQGELWNRRKNGNEFISALKITIVPGPGIGPPVRYVGLFSDVTELMREHHELARRAHHDELTGLANRTMMTDRLDLLVHQSLRDRRSLAVVYLDLDEFKPVNDRLGHAAGDQVLITVARRLRETLRAGDTVARLGGDEFVLLLPGQDQDEPLMNLLDRIIEAVSAPMAVEDEQVRVSASLGVALCPQHARSAEDLLQRADEAMYAAKHAGRNRYMLADREPTAQD